MANPVRATIGTVSPVAGSEAVHNRVDSTQGMATIQLATNVLIVGRSTLGNKLGLVEASMALSAGNVTVIDLLCGEPLIIFTVGGLGSWLG